MGKHNNEVPNQHFKKKWQFNVQTWFNQPARKVRRRAGAPCSPCVAVAHGRRTGTLGGCVAMLCFRAGP